MSDLMIFLDDNKKILEMMNDSTIDLIYVDPPYNTGKTQKLNDYKYSDKFDSYIDFMKPLFEESHRVLKNTGSIFVHLDYREVHYVKVELDKIFGRDNFKNEIIWHYDFGGKAKKFWPRKHDNILYYTKSDKYTYNYEDIEYIPYMSNMCNDKDKLERGKKPTDTWWFSIVGTNSNERTGYPTQKPLKLLERIIKTHSKEGEIVLDFFAGSGTTGEACLNLDRHCILIDSNPELANIWAKRFHKFKNDSRKIELLIDERL